jgi:hypothetical protein
MGKEKVHKESRRREKNRAEQEACCGKECATGCGRNPQEDAKGK